MRSRLPQWRQTQGDFLCGAQTARLRSGPALGRREPAAATSQCVRRRRRAYGRARNCVCCGGGGACGHAGSRIWNVRVFAGAEARRLARPGGAQSAAPQQHVLMLGWGPATTPSWHARPTAPRPNVRAPSPGSQAVWRACRRATCVHTGGWAVPIGIGIGRGGGGGGGGAAAAQGWVHKLENVQRVRWRPVIIMPAPGKTNARSPAWAAQAPHRRG